MYGGGKKDIAMRMYESYAARFRRTYLRIKLLECKIMENWRKTKKWEICKFSHVKILELKISMGIYTFITCVTYSRKGGGSRGLESLSTEMLEK